MDMQLVTFLVPEKSNLLGGGGQNCMELRWDSRLFPVSVLNEGEVLHYQLHCYM